MTQSVQQPIRSKQNSNKFCQKSKNMISRIFWKGLPRPHIYNTILFYFSGERRFGQKYHLAIHVSAVHEGKKPYACDMCSHKSARKSGLQRHMRTVHNIKNPVIASQPLSSVIMPGDPSNSMSNNPQQQQQPQHQTVTYTVTAQ